ncbi:hypothetical protein ES703_61869 [subsurface metagenome]
MTGVGKALLIIKEKEVKYSRDFAKLMWPDSPCWQKVYNVGSGATRGVGMWLAGGSFLGKLYQKGYIHQFYGERIRLTSKGEDRLRSEVNRSKGER